MKGIHITGIKEAVNAIDKRIRQYIPFMESAIQTATRDGAVIADMYFHNYSEHGDSSPAVVCRALETTVEGETINGGVEATGRAVVFLEFGAGDVTGFGEHGETIENFEMETGIPIAAGEYSRTEGTGEYARTGQWHWEGMTFRGVYPRRGMYRASQDIQVELSDPNSQSYESAGSILGGGE